MKKEKQIPPLPTEKQSGKGSNPENKFKKGNPATSADNISTSVVAKVKASSGNGLANEGTSVSYEE